MKIKRTMGSMEFAAQYQQAPVPRDGNLIKWSWFEFYELTAQARSRRPPDRELGHCNEQQSAF